MKHNKKIRDDKTNHLKNKPSLIEKCDIDMSGLTVSRNGRCKPKNFPPLNMIGGPEKLVSKVCNYKIRNYISF